VLFHLSSLSKPMEIRPLQKILVTGATGYVGGRLVPRLLEEGVSVRVFARQPSQLQGRSWLERVEVVQGDAINPERLSAVMQGMDAAYYLIHGMSSGTDFYQRDLMVARNFGQAARIAGLQRIIYLGGLGGGHEGDLSEHLRSRHEVGVVLAESGVPVIEFRAAVVVGSGSAAFEMMRYPVEGMPILFCPSWVSTRIQPISVRDVQDYLIASLKVSEEQVGKHRIIEIGGSEVLTYHEMMRGYAKARGLRRMMISVPFLTPPVCAAFLHWVSPIPVQLARALIEGMRNEVVVHDDSAMQLFSEIHPRDYRTSLDRALARIVADEVETTWSDAQVSALGDAVPVTLTTRQGLLLEERQRLIAASPETIYSILTGLGGKRGWLYANWIWRFRGILDWLVGGVGFRRGRRHPDELRVGDALDFWRVESLIPDRLIRLRAEMKVPGLAWLQFEINPQTLQRNLLIQTAYFEPKGVPGLVYWYVLYPIHGWMFSKLISKIAGRAEEAELHPAVG
jgi:uncharacterized protein YbjT (DUF2867 family)